jgi:hypothetical protein
MEQEDGFHGSSDGGYPWNPGLILILCKNMQKVYGGFHKWGFPKMDSLWWKIHKTKSNLFKGIPKSWGYPFIAGWFIRENPSDMDEN